MKTEIEALRREAQDLVRRAREQNAQLQLLLAMAKQFRSETETCTVIRLDDYRLNRDPAVKPYRESNHDQDDQDDDQEGT